MKIVVQKDRSIPRPTRQEGSFELILIPDTWDDFGFKTSYDLWIRNSEGAVSKIGFMKIGYLAMPRGQHPIAAGEYTGLDFKFYSVGQDVEYYETLSNLSGDIRSACLIMLRDAAFDREIEQMARSDEAFNVSLLRVVKETDVSGAFRRYAQEGFLQESFQVSFNDQENYQGEPIRMNVIPGSSPPTNVHAVVGGNGVGKTLLMRRLATAIVNRRPSIQIAGSTDSVDGKFECSSVIAVSFSAFDRPWKPEPLQAIPLFSIGFARASAASRPPDGDTNGSSGPVVAASDGSGHREDYVVPLLEQFELSVVELVAAGREDQWAQLVEQLLSDPVLARIDPVGALFPEGVGGRRAYAFDNMTLKTRARELFDPLSSGHKIVLLTITRLVELVSEKSVILIDEPESHLHPPLMASFIRTLSDFIGRKNGIAVIATHSPVAIQEIPRTCTFKLYPGGYLMRPEMETYGEAFGRLARDVFGLELDRSGFYADVAKAYDGLRDRNRVLEMFAGQLGGEALTILHALSIRGEGRSSAARSTLPG